MKNGYSTLTLLTDKLNYTSIFITELSKINKEDFSKKEKLIISSVGILNEIKEIIYAINENIYILSPSLHDLLAPIANYADNMINEYGFANAYKLYDVMTIDIVNLQIKLNKIKDS